MEAWLQRHQTHGCEVPRDISANPNTRLANVLANHMHDAAAIDMFVVISMSFRLLYAIIIIGLNRRKIIHVSTTEHPTQEWLSNEVSQAFAKNPKPKYLIRDRDCCYGRKFSQRVKELGIREHVIAKQSPWQNVYVERVIGSIRREGICDEY